MSPVNQTCLNGGILCIWQIFMTVLGYIINYHMVNIGVIDRNKIDMWLFMITEFMFRVTLPEVPHTSPSSPLLVSFNKFVCNQTMYLYDQDIKLMNLLLHSTIAHQHHFHHHHTTIIHSCPRQQHNLEHINKN